MGKVIVGVLDTKVHAYKFIAVENNIVEAHRSFEQGVNDERTIVNKYPEEHELYLLGNVDEISGKIEPVFPPVFIIGAKMLKKEEVKK